MGRWWNAVIEIRVPFDTAEEAEAFPDGDVIDRLIEILGRNVSIGGRIEEAVEGVWPY